MTTLKYVALLACLFVCASFAQAASVTVAKGTDGKERVILENDLCRLQVDPARGARVDGFRYTPWGAINILRDPNMHGLLVDHFWQEFWPGQFWEAKYDYQIITNSPAEVAVKFSCLSKGIPQVAGILLEKTVTLREHDRTVKVTVRLTNTTAEGKYIGYWLQNVCWLGGDKEDDQYFRPSKRGIDHTSSEEANPRNNGFVREPQAGWSAAIDGKTQTGLVFFMDYHSLWFLYNCTPASTVEWQDDAVAIPAGKSWQTEVSITPTTKLPSVEYASTRLLMGTAFKEDKDAGRLVVTQTYLAASQPLKSITAQTSLETLQTHQKQESAAQTLTNVGFEPQTLTVSLPYDTIKREQSVVRLIFTGETAAGEAFSESTELFYRGSRVSNDDPNSPSGSPYYTIAGPKKVRASIKPDKIVRIVKDQPQVLFIRGLFAPEFQLEPALKTVRPDVQVKASYMYSGGVFGQQLDYFPYDYNDLMSYDLVVLGDVTAACLGDVALEMLKDYCAHGGNLLVLGGPVAYGCGGYQATVLNDILPVSCPQNSRLAPAGKGRLQGAFPAGSVPPRVWKTLRPAYLNQVIAKPDARVLLSYGASPLIALGKYGDGAVCCVMLTPLGESNICATPQWQQVLTYLVTTLGVKR
ncbi:MAG: glutamine amidotransferase [Armatimonadota bacterium]